MTNPNRWRALLRRAAELYDAPGSILASRAPQAARGGFRSGADWMRDAMELLRGEAVCGPVPGTSFHALGIIKYTAATLVALAVAAAAVLVDLPVLVLLAVPFFYAVEAQGVFLFPVALEGSPRPFRDARRRTVQAGGTLRVMSTVMPIAAVMLFGGFAGRGFLRCWCLGCLAVCVWSENVRTRESCDAADVRRLRPAADP